MEKILKELLEGQKQLFAGQKQLFEGQKQIMERLDRIDTTMVTKDHLDKVLFEQQEDVKSMLQHISNKLDAQAADIKSVAEITGDHEMRIRTLTRRPV